MLTLQIRCPLRELAENVRAWATFLLHNQAFDANDQAFKLEAAVHLFEEKADKLEELRKQCWMETFGRHGFQRRFKMVQLLRLIVLVRDIRTATRTKQVLVAALGSIFPAEEMSFLQQVINDGSLVPGKSVLYNMRFIVDMGFMLHMRGVLHEVFGSVSAADMQQPAVYLLVDSSLQGGKNALNSEYDLIAADNMLRLGDVFLAIRETLQVLHAGGMSGRGSKQGCPFRRRRGPELAFGDLLRMVEQLLAAGNQEIAGRIVGHLTPQEQAKVVEDFEGAKQHLLFRMRVQFAVWTSLPRLLVGMCHPDEREGRRCAAQALIQFRGYSPAQKQQAHFLTRRFCDPGHAAKSLRLFMTQFIGGATLISLPVLRFHALRLAFIPICEMSVERMHAVTKSVITHGSHSASLPSLSLGNRWPEFLRALQQPNRFQWFADTCTQVYDPLRACPVFGIAQHPDLAAAFQGVEDISLLNLLGSTFKWSKTVKGIIYRSNFHLQFQDVSSCKKPPEEPHVEVAPLAAPVPDKLEDQLLNIEAMQTFTEVMGPGTFYFQI